MNKDKVYVQGYVVGFSADAMGYKGLRIQLPNMDIVEIDESLVYRNIDEQQEPVVKQFVADWIKYCKRTGVELQHALNMEDLYFCNYANQKDDLKLKEFFETENNQDLFARAWLDGYTVEKEKRYTVKIRGKVEENLLVYGLGINKYFFTRTYDSSKRKGHTRKELEEAGFGEVFNSPLFEVEEVEE